MKEGELSINTAEMKDSCMTTMWRIKKINSTA
jgi:hypothetical protein